MRVGVLSASQWGVFLWLCMHVCHDGRRHWLGQTDRATPTLWTYQGKWSQGTVCQSEVMLRCSRDNMALCICCTYTFYSVMHNPCASKWLVLTFLKLYITIQLLVLNESCKSYLIHAVTVMVLLHREILVEESNVQRVDSPVTVSISVSFYNL